ncbi:uncharacterized protein LOC124150856 [Haliotis rufescens]|uniref:uncharacterized protein LOC124150856 n=1 Tax=Haliotis rufescens TaxID=6454 RepID=UPI00201EEC7A|nr:uncharacterized protein LOC124150856 [Haliotis rufescens]XP_048248267.1 uncharacterized protein LOC124150856 [Haliotis rufescens]
MKHCQSGQYYDKAVSRCQGCNEICYWEYLKDPNSDCNKFCPEFFQAGHAGQDGPASTPVNVPMLVSICGVMVVIAMVLVFLWRRFRRRDQTSTNTVQATTLVAQPSDNTPVQQDDMGFAELCIGSGTGDHLLTGEDYSGN